MCTVSATAHFRMRVHVRGKLPRRDLLLCNAWRQFWVRISVWDAAHYACTMCKIHAARIVDASALSPDKQAFSARIRVQKSRSVNIKYDPWPRVLAHMRAVQYGQQAKFTFSSYASVLSLKSLRYSPVRFDDIMCTWPYSSRFMLAMFHI